MSSLDCKTLCEGLMFYIQCGDITKTCGLRVVFDKIFWSYYTTSSTGYPTHDLPEKMPLNQCSCKINYIILPTAISLTIP